MAPFPPPRAVLALLGSLLIGVPLAQAEIDREALVRRHNPNHHTEKELHLELEASDHAAAQTVPCYFQVGNGRFALAVDATGFQGHSDCNLLSDWAWHTEPPPDGLSPETFPWSAFKDPTGREIRFPWIGLANDGAYKGAHLQLSPEQAKAGEYQRANPHRLNLARIYLVLLDADGRERKSLPALEQINQELDQWTGLIRSRFMIEGETVEVLTCADSEKDLLAWRVRSHLLQSGRLAVRVAFPYGDARFSASAVGVWTTPEKHQTRILSQNRQDALIEHRLDTSGYALQLAWDRPLTTLETSGDHRFTLQGQAGADTLELTAEFLSTIPSSLAPGQATLTGPTLSFSRIRERSARHWRQFWQSGAAIDFTGSTDPRAALLERRIVQSQYLLAVQEAGTLPPQEAGLYNNGWYGKFHLEMTWWHLAHYFLWNRPELARPALGFYASHLQEARALAESQGYGGLRWPKMTGPEGRQSPSGIAPFLIWQQPHPILFAEMDYRANPTRETLERWKEVVFGTAEFMADLPLPNAKTGKRDLAPPLKTVPENTSITDTLNPAFELSYWRFGLRVAQIWRQRLGLQPEPRWQRVLEQLAPLPHTEAGLYLYAESQPDTFEHYTWEHPSLVAMYGWLPGDGADPERVRKTLHEVVKKWDPNRLWGWDYPLLALSAARLGEPELAVNLLCTPSPNFQFANNGLATGGPWPYFPSNGSLLYAIGFMAGGWDGCPAGAAPGFPHSKGWHIQVEGFRQAY